MSGPLEELRAADKRLCALEARSADAKAVGVAEWVEAERAVRVAARALLAASGTGERPADDPHDRLWFTPPDAGTGTPSDDGREPVTFIDPGTKKRHALTAREAGR